MKKSYLVFAVLLFQLKLFAQPVVSAPTPPVRNTADVISVYSDAYTNVSGTDFFPNWGQSTQMADITIGTNNIKKYSNFNYEGFQFVSSIDASNMKKLHIDIWTSDCTAFDLYLINTSPSTVEQKVTITPTASGWTSTDIDLAQYTNIALHNIGQFKLVSTPFGGTTVYLDNIYFWKAANVPTITNFVVPAKVVGDAPFTITPPTSNSTGAFTYTSSNNSVATISGNTITITGGGTSYITATQAAAGSFVSGAISTTLLVTFPSLTVAAPTPPARLPVNVKSIFSGAYTDITGTDFFPNWSQSTQVSDVMIAGNATKKYDFLNYEGTQFSSPLNLTSMDSLHIDIWTPNVTAFDLYLINTNPPVPPAVSEQKYSITPTLYGWNSINIPLSAYTARIETVDISAISQLKFVGLPSGSGTLYMDNLYFYKSTTLPIKLMSFDVIKNGDKAAIAWKTASETNCKGYNIQRSANGKDWITINYVSSAVNSTTEKSYSIVDNNPMKGVNYYRLKQEDLDGTFTFSEIKTLQFSNANNLSLTFYPNPVKDKMYININNLAESRVVLEIVNSNGQTLKRSEISVQNGSSNESIDVKGFAKGTYYLRLNSSNNILMTHSFIIE